MENNKAHLNFTEIHNNSASIDDQLYFEEVKIDHVALKQQGSSIGGVDLQDTSK